MLTKNIKLESSHLPKHLQLLDMWCEIFMPHSTTQVEVLAMVWAWELLKSTSTQYVSEGDKGKHYKWPFFHFTILNRARSIIILNAWSAMLFLL